MKTTGILFDLDGTLLNTLEDLLDATNATLEQFGRPRRTLQELRSFVGNGARNQLRLSLSGRDDDPDLDGRWNGIRRTTPPTARSKRPPIPGCRSC